ATGCVTSAAEAPWRLSSGCGRDIGNDSREASAPGQSPKIWPLSATSAAGEGSGLCALGWVAADRRRPEHALQAQGFPKDGDASMFKNKIRTAAVGIAAAAAAIGALSPPGTAWAMNGPVPGCAFQTTNGHYLTAVGGGGRTTDVIHTDAVSIRSWEKFT